MNSTTGTFSLFLCLLFSFPLIRVRRNVYVCTPKGIYVIMGYCMRTIHSLSECNKSCSIYHKSQHRGPCRLHGDTDDTNNLALRTEKRIHFIFGPKPKRKNVPIQIRNCLIHFVHVNQKCLMHLKNVAFKALNSPRARSIREHFSARRLSGNETDGRFRELRWSEAKCVDKSNEK